MSGYCVFLFEFQLLLKLQRDTRQNLNCHKKKPLDFLKIAFIICFIEVLSNIKDTVSSLGKYSSWIYFMQV